MEVALLAIGLGLQIGAGVTGASAARKSARASMAALASESSWNLATMRQNKIDTYARNILDSWGSGIDPTTGSNRAVIENNQRVLQEEIDFQQQQYAAQMKNLKAQSKQKFLGLF